MTKAQELLKELQEANGNLMVDIGIYKSVRNSNTIKALLRTGKVKIVRSEMNAGYTGYSWVELALITEEVATEEVATEEVVLNGEVLETIEGESEAAQPNAKAYDTEDAQGFNLIDNGLGQEIEFYCEHNGTEIIPFLQSLNLCSYEERRYNGDTFAYFDEDELRAAFNSITNKNR